MGGKLTKTIATSGYKTNKFSFARKLESEAGLCEPSSKDKQKETKPTLQIQRNSI